ncbi:MAG: hypothetical protein GXX09_05745 [Syntrophomonadaceae bacterium]|nr:hypothetical protein [Syntrophomonadaceae bacterium]
MLAVSEQGRSISPNLNPANVDQTRSGVEVWNGATKNGELIKSSDVVLITGTVLVNGTGEDILKAIGVKPFYFYDTTAAGMAAMNEFLRLCPMSK